MHLYISRAQARVDKFNTEYPNGFRGTLQEGFDVVDRYLPPRRAAMIAAMKELEHHFGPITWGEMTFQLRVTHMRYGIGKQCGANQTVVGVTDDGVEIWYRYRQPLSAESGNREFKHAGDRWCSISQIESFLAA